MTIPLRHGEVAIRCPYCSEEVAFDCFEDGQGDFIGPHDCFECGKTFDVASDLSFGAEAIEPKEMRRERLRKERTP